MVKFKYKPEAIISLKIAHRNDMGFILRLRQKLVQNPFGLKIDYEKIAPHHLIVKKLIWSQPLYGRFHGGVVSSAGRAAAPLRKFSEKWHIFRKFSKL